MTRSHRKDCWKRLRALTTPATKDDVPRPTASLRAVGIKRCRRHATGASRAGLQTELRLSALLSRPLEDSRSGVACCHSAWDCGRDSFRFQQSLRPERDARTLIDF